MRYLQADLLLKFLFVIFFETKKGSLPGCQSTIPETCGQAMDVPLIVLVAVSLVCQVLVMSLPGAKISTQFP